MGVGTERRNKMANQSMTYSVNGNVLASVGGSGSNRTDIPGRYGSGGQRTWDATWSAGRYDALVNYIKSGATAAEAYNKYGGMGTDVYTAYQKWGRQYPGLERGTGSSSSSGTSTSSTASNLSSASSDPIGAYASAYDKAKAANESRYQDILNQYQASYTRNMANLDQYGAQESADINQRYSELAAQGTQDLTSRGLGNTTVTGTMATGVANQASAEQRRLASDIAQQKYIADTALTNTKLGFMERKTDSYPDLNTYLQLAQYSNQLSNPTFAYTTGGGNTSTGSSNTGYSGFKTGQISTAQNYYT